MTDSIDVRRNANVVCEPVIENNGVNGRICLRITVDDRYIHTFPASSKESGELLSLNIDALSMRYSGGTYVFVDDRLVEYRRGDYTGFIHNKDAVAQLAELIGITDRDDLHGSASMVQRRLGSNGILMGGPGDQFELAVPELGEGGEFNNQLFYSWSVFSPNVESSLLSERVVCENGQVATDKIVSFETPLVSDMENNLRVLSAQIKPKIRNELSQRFLSMSETRASVYDINKASDLLEERMKGDEKADAALAKMVDAMRSHLNVQKHLGDFYSQSVIQDRRLSKQAPGHVTQYDVFNMLTEASTHSPGYTGVDEEMQRVANKLAFRAVNDTKKVVSEAPSKMPDSDHRRAFFGKRA